MSLGLEFKSFGSCIFLDGVEVGSTYLIFSYGKWYLMKKVCVYG